MSELRFIAAERPIIGERLVGQGPLERNEFSGACLFEFELVCNTSVSNTQSLLASELAIRGDRLLGQRPLERKRVLLAYLS